MGYQTGYGGSLRWLEGSPATPGWNATILDWQLRYGMRSHETPVMGSAIRTTPMVSITDGLNYWIADVQFLIDSALASGTFAVPVTVIVALDLNQTPDYFSSTGRLISYDISCPLDRAVMGTARIVASGASMGHTGA